MNADWGHTTFPFPDYFWFFAFQHRSRVFYSTVPFKLVESGRDRCLALQVRCCLQHPHPYWSTWVQGIPLLNFSALSGIQWYWMGREKQSWWGSGPDNSPCSISVHNKSTQGIPQPFRSHDLKQIWYLMKLELLLEAYRNIHHKRKSYQLFEEMLIIWIGSTPHLQFSIFSKALQSLRKQAK